MGDAAKITLSAMQQKCLAALVELSRPHGEMCRPFRVIESATGMARTDVRRSVRALFRKGLAEFHSGLCTEDGEFAGAGYCISAAGLTRAAEAIRKVRQSIPDDVNSDAEIFEDRSSALIAETKRQLSLLSEKFADAIYGDGAEQ